MKCDAIYKSLPQAGQDYFQLFCTALKYGKVAGKYLVISCAKSGHSGALPKPWAKAVTNTYGVEFIAVARVEKGHLLPLKNRSKAEKALDELRESIKQSADKRLVENYTRAIERAAKSKKAHDVAKKLIEFLQQAHEQLDLPLYDLSFATDRGLVRNRKAAYAALNKAIHANLSNLPRFLKAILTCLNQDKWLQLQQDDRRLGKFHVGLLANEAFLRKVEAL